MLTQNRLWGETTVSIGLMNGARGIVVGIVYTDAGERRVDGQGVSSGVPDGDHSPLPECVVVHFPECAGPALSEGCPRTWVPVPVV